MEKNFDSRELLKDLYDFGQGIPCGASHISASKVCRVGVAGGTEVSARLSEKEAAVLNEYGEMMQKIWEDGNLDEAAELVATMNDRTEDTLTKLKNGDLTYDELENWAVQGSEGGNWMEASMIVVGLEPGAGMLNDPTVDAHRVLAEDIAIGTMYGNAGPSNTPRMAQAVKMIPQEETQEVRWWTSVVKDDIKALQAKPPSRTFTRKVAGMEAVANATPFANPMTTYMSSKVTVLDQSIIRGVSVKDSRLYDILGKQKDPRVAAIGKGGRDAFKKEFAERRSRDILGKINQAAADNPKFKGGIALPGPLSKGLRVDPGENWKAYEKMAVEHRRAGGKVFLTDYKFTGKDGTSYTTPIMTFQMANNHAFVVPMATGSSNPITPAIMTSMFNAGKASMGPGKPEWTSPIKARGADGKVIEPKVKVPRAAKAPKPAKKATTSTKNLTANKQRSDQRVTQQRSQADRRAQQKAAMMTQVQTLRAQGRSDAAIRERLKPIYGSLVSSI